MDSFKWLTTLGIICFLGVSSITYYIVTLPSKRPFVPIQYQPLKQDTAPEMFKKCERENNCALPQGK